MGLDTPKMHVLGVHVISYDFMGACKGMDRSMAPDQGPRSLSPEWFRDPHPDSCSQPRLLLKGWLRPGEIAKSARPPQQERYKVLQSS